MPLRALPGEADTPRGNVIRRRDDGHDGPIEPA
jgi:hypothetical protein